MQPEVSIIMPLYNAERYVAQAISSVISQTYQSWELLIVDDCSTDSSYRIVENMANRDNRIHLLQTEKPSGSPTLPRNIGIGKACGRYIAFLDSDDAWLPNKLEEQLPLFANDQTIIVFSYYKKMTADGEILKNTITSPACVNYNQLLKGNVIGNLTGIYDTQKTGKHYFEKIGHEDYVYWLHILKKGGIAKNTGKVHALYRIGQESVSSNKLKVARWDWNIFRNIEHLSLMRSCFCFVSYAIKGMIKYFK